VKVGGFLILYLRGSGQTWKFRWLYLKNSGEDEVSDLISLTNVITSELEAGLKHAFLALGLSKYEAQVLVALYVLKESEVKTIATVAKVPIGRIYEALNSLTEKSLIQKIKIRGKPLRYRANDFKVSLGNVYNNVKSEIDEAFKQVLEGVEQLQDITVRVKPSHDPIEVFYGDWNIAMALKETILSTKRDIILSLSVEYIKNHKASLETLVRKNISAIGICISKKEMEELETIGISSCHLDLNTHMPVLKEFFHEESFRINGVMVDDKMVFLTLLQADNEPYGILITLPSLVQTFSILLQSLMFQISSPHL